MKIKGQIEFSWTVKDAKKISEENEWYLEDKAIHYIRDMVGLQFREGELCDLTITENGKEIAVKGWWTYLTNTIRNE